MKMGVQTKLPLQNQNVTFNSVPGPKNSDTAQKNEATDS
jgi:hypothetical protein